MQVWTESCHQFISQKWCSGLTALARAAVQWFGCSSTTAQTYLTCPCTLGWGCGGCVLPPPPLPLCFLSYFFKVFFIFIGRQHHAPSTADPQWYQNCTCSFSALHNLALLQKEVLSCTPCSCPLLLPVPVCVCASVAFVWLHRGLAWGHDLAGGLKRQVWSCHRWRRGPSVRTLGLLCPAGIVAWKCCISIAGS